MCSQKTIILFERMTSMNEEGTSWLIMKIWVIVNGYPISLSFQYLLYIIGGTVVEDSSRERSRVIDVSKDKLLRI